MLFSVHARLRVHWAPGIPCALCSQSGERSCKISGASRREHMEPCRHCEEQSDEAIHSYFAATWIASLTLAMTVLENRISNLHSKCKQSNWVVHAMHKCDSREPCFHPPQPLQLHHHFISRIKPHRLDQAPGQHELSRAQALAIGGKMIGEPCQRVVRMI